MGKWMGPRGVGHEVSSSITINLQAVFHTFEHPEIRSGNPRTPRGDGPGPRRTGARGMLTRFNKLFHVLERGREPPPLRHPVAATWTSQ